MPEMIPHAWPIKAEPRDFAMAYGYHPYAIVQTTLDVVELISYPYRAEDGEMMVKARTTIDDPTTMIDVNCRHLLEVKATCKEMYHV